MKNKRIIIILCAILGVLILSTLGYIISSNIIKSGQDKQRPTKDTSIVINETKNDVENINEDNNKDEKKYENIVLTSKIGNEILSKFCISNIFSSTIYNKIDESGFSDEAKLIYTYVTINSNYYYHNMIKSSNEIGEYITKEDFEMVYKELFGSQSIINHKSVITDTLYNEEKGYYEYLTLGYGGIEFDFIVEIPYEIREYEDKVEALFYRLYCKASSSVNEDGESKQLVSLYDNATRITEIYTSEDVRLQDNDSQQEFITDLIENNTIDKNILETVTYTLKEENDSYYISDVER